MTYDACSSRPLPSHVDYYWARSNVGKLDLPCIARCGRPFVVGGLARFDGVITARKSIEAYHNQASGIIVEFYRKKKKNFVECVNVDKPSTLQIVYWNVRTGTRIIRKRSLSNGRTHANT